MFLVKFVHLGCNGLHELAKLFPHRSEIALYFLDQNTLSFNKVQFLHIDFALDEFLDGLNVLLLFFADGWYHDLLKRLTNLDVDFATQGQCHRGNLLGHLHARFKVAVDETFIGYREKVEVNTVKRTAKVSVKFV